MEVVDFRSVFIVLWVVDPLELDELLNDLRDSEEVVRRFFRSKMKPYLEPTWADH